METTTQWLPVAILATLGFALVAAILWAANRLGPNVERPPGTRQVQRAGFYWSIAGTVIVVDCLLLTVEGPRVMLPFVAGVADGPITSWLLYTGGVFFAGSQSQKFSLPLALSATLLWFGLHHSEAFALRTLVGAGTASFFTFATIRVIKPVVRTTLERVFMFMLYVPATLLLMRPAFQAIAVPPVEIVVMWVAPLTAMGIVTLLMLLEQEATASRNIVQQQALQLRLGERVSGMGTWTVNLGNGEVQWSDELYTIHGLAQNSTLPDSDTILKLLDPEDRASFSEAIGKMLQTQGSFDYDYRMTSLDGQSRIMRARAEHIHRPNDDDLIVGTSLDITAYRKALDQLGLYRNQLEKLVEERTSELAVSQRKLQHAERLASIGTLAAGVAHQVNNPVGAILAAAEFAGGSRNEHDEIDILRKAVADIASEAHRCGEIVRDMLRFASAGASERKPHAVDEVLTRSRQAVHRQITSKQAQVVLDLSGPSPWVESSNIELEQAMINLLENALQSRETEILVKVERRIENGTVHIAVRDNGCGIAPEDLDRVLDPFFTSRLEHGGTGLGLSVAHGIARGHGGTLTIESEKGVGTLATLSLPISA